MANVSAFTGAMPVIPGGKVDIARLERTTSYTVNQTATSSASNIFSSNISLVADGATTYQVEFFCPIAQVGSTGNVNVYLTDGGSTVLARLAQIYGSASGVHCSMVGSLFIKPAAGTYTYNARSVYATATGNLVADTGSGDVWSPITLRISKIVNQNDGLKPFWTPPVVTQLPSQATEGDQVLLYSSSPYAGYQTHQYASGSWRTLDDSRGFGAWQSWTPQLTQNGNRTSSTGDSRYIQMGKTVIACGVHTGLQIGSAGSAIRSTLPVTPATQSQAIGSFWYLRSGAAFYVGTTKKQSGSTIEFQTNISASGPIGADPSFATGTSDQLFYSVTYEAA